MIRVSDRMVLKIWLVFIAESPLVTPHLISTNVTLALAWISFHIFVLSQCCIGANAMSTEDIELISGLNCIRESITLSVSRLWWSIGCIVPFHI
jgi:hypothetical protein